MSGKRRYKVKKKKKGIRCLNVLKIERQSMQKLKESR